MMMMMICPRANIYVVTRCSDHPESAVRYTRDLGMQSLDMKHSTSNALSCCYLQSAAWSKCLLSATTLHHSQPFSNSVHL